ncbi:MAG: helix-turn-helix transcriptional regulator [Cyanobacteria bacterium P01_C01_bin.38]
MSDIEKYIAKRKLLDAEFEENFESGYASFKIGFLLEQARINAGMTQKDLASQLNIDESTIINIENNTQDIGIFTLEKYAKALGKHLVIDLK